MEGGKGRGNRERGMMVEIGFTCLVDLVLDNFKIPVSSTSTH